jgi:predicted nucleic acid-binding protein
MEIGPAVLDTDTLSELCRGNLRVRTRATAYLHSFGRLTTTAVTVFERLRGYQLAIRRGKPFERQLQTFEALLSTCIVLPFDSDAGAVAARMWAALSRAQQQGTGDIMIAAVAASRQLPVVTRNRGDFERISRSSGIELKLLDWAS